MTSSSKVAVGVSTYLGVLLSVLGAAGAVVAAVKANDTATVTSGVGAIVAVLVTLGGRMAQAVALARRVAPVAGAVLAGVTLVPGDEEPGDGLDGLPDLATHPPDGVGDHLGDPVTRGEVTL